MQRHTTKPTQGYSSAASDVYKRQDKHYQVVKEEATYTKLDMPHVEAHPHHDVAIDGDSHEVEIG